MLPTVVAVLSVLDGSPSIIPTDGRTGAQTNLLADKPARTNEVCRLGDDIKVVAFSGRRMLSPRGSFIEPSIKFARQAIGYQTSKPPKTVEVKPDTGCVRISLRCDELLVCFRSVCKPSRAVIEYLLMLRGNLYCLQYPQALGIL